MLIDQAKITIKSGDGGNGCVSFRREKFVPKGGPNGGDGGKGGDIIFQAENSLATLIDFRYKRFYKADKGVNGLGGDKTGRDAKDIIIRVPCGSVIRNAETKELLADLIKDKQTFKTACEFTSGAIIGSAYIKALQGGNDIYSTTKSFLNEIIK